MTTETTREPEMGLTFEKVWAALMEDREAQREAQRELRESQRETERLLKEMSQATDRKISKLGSRVGELVEHLMTPGMLDKFNKLGYDFGKISPNVRYKDPGDLLIGEVDLLLENGDVVLAVEVKTKLSIDDVKEHIGRMEKLRIYADRHGDRRRLMGAVAGAVIPDGVKPFALKSGFYIIEQAGDTVKLDIPEGFNPKEW